MPAPPPSSTAEYRNDLQGLRALAILLVVLCHAGAPGFSGGFIGVDVFFVLSGYLITRLLLLELEKSQGIGLTRFYARRLRRLLPAMAFMVLVVTGAALWLLSGQEAAEQLASAPYAATWTSNLYFAFSNFGYFDELSERDLFLHTWSLGVEEQFYLVWPLVLIAGVLIAGTRFAREARFALPAVLGLLMAASFALSLYWTKVAPNSAYYLMPSRVWQFALGGLMCLPLRIMLSSSSARIALWSGLALIVGSALLLHSSAPYPGFRAVFPALGTALVLASGHARSDLHGNPLSWRAAVWLGDRSYSWYLWHWPVLVLGASLGLQGSPELVTGLVLLSLVVAVLSYRWIELPFWKGRFVVPVPRTAVLGSMLVIVFTVALSVQATRSTVIEVNAPNGRVRVPVIYQMGCDAWYEHARVEPCVVGSDAATRTVVLVGDSIGAQWYSLLPEAFPQPEWRIVVLTKSACAIVDEEYFYERIGAYYDVCTEWRNAVLNWLDGTMPDVVIMGSSPRYAFTESQWTNGSARIYERLASAASKVFVLAGTPSLGFHGPGCVARGSGSCDARYRLANADRVTRYLENAADSFPSVRVIDLNDIVCPDGVCSAVSHDGLLVFRDGNHLSDDFVVSRAPFVRERFSVEF